MRTTVDGRDMCLSITHLFFGLSDLFRYASIAKPLSLVAANRSVVFCCRLRPSTPGPHHCKVVPPRFDQTLTTGLLNSPRRQITHTRKQQAAGLLHERARAGGRHEDVQEQGELPHDGRLREALRRRRDQVSRVPLPCLICLRPHPALYRGDCYAQAVDEAEHQCVREERVSADCRCC